MRHQERGWSAIINDRLLNRILLLGVFVITAVTTAVVVTIVGHFSGVDSDAQVAAGVCAALIAASVAMVIVSVVEGAIATVFVCFAQDHATLAHNHPEDHRVLSEAWCLAHPDVAAGCGLSMPGMSGSLVGMTMLATTATGGV